jgi:hypothetical protein
MPKIAARYPGKFNEKLRPTVRMSMCPTWIFSRSHPTAMFIKKYYLADEVHCNSRIVPFTRKTIAAAFRGTKKIR